MKLKIMFMCGFKTEEEETAALYRQEEIQVVTAKV